MTEHPIIKCVERAVQYIAHQLNEDKAPSLQDVASASGISKFHFHRMYKLVTGETCAQTITRLRLAKGGNALLDNSTSITEAALSAGYNSSQAFAKALKRELSESASSLRSDPQRLAETVQTLAEPEQWTNLPNIPPARIEACSLDPIVVAFVRTSDSYPDLVETYGQLIGALNNPENLKAVLGIPQRDIETYEQNGFVFDCALLSNNSDQLPQGLQQYTIPAGDYLLVRHKGLDKDLPATLNALYAFILSQDDMIISDTPCIHHYIDDPEEVEEALCRTDIYVKVETLIS